MKLENILKNKDKYIIELLERNEGLGTENQKLKEKMQASTVLFRTITKYHASE